MLNDTSWRGDAAWRAAIMAFIDSDNPLAAEILQEAAEVYFAACRKMAAFLEALRTFDRSTALSAPNEEWLRRRSQLLDDAAEQVHFVLIQRDAMKLSSAETFFEDYGIPEEVRVRLGRRR